MDQECSYGQDQLNVQGSCHYHALHSTAGQQVLLALHSVEDCHVMLLITEMISPCHNDTLQTLFLAQLVGILDLYQLDLQRDHAKEQISLF